MKKVAKGFTLIELMIVVAIIGILAAIAIPNFIKYQLRSKFSEASSNIEGLRKAEESLRQSERLLTIAGVPVAIAAFPGSQYWDLGAAFMPNDPAIPLGTTKIGWLPGEMNLANAIDWQVEGATYFQYQVTTTIKGVPVGTQAGIAYSIGARSNIDGTGANGEVILVKESMEPVPQRSAQPAIVTTAFPGVLGTSTCVDNNSKPIFGMPCTLTNADTF
jgi:type IV pilus assembly protein PilA